MNIFYFSNDEVHMSLAEELALGCGAAIHGFRPDREPPRGQRPDAALYDLDAVAPERHLEILNRVLAGARGCPAAVHGYRITDKQAATLRRLGVAVAQHLCTELLMALCRAARRNSATIPPDDAMTELTWISLDP